MSKYLFTDGKVSVAGVDLSNHAFGIETPDSRDQVDVSGFSPTGAKEFLPGQKDQSIVVRFLQDFAASKVHATLQPLYSGGSTFIVYVVPDSDTTVSATNPAYGGSASLFEYNGLAGELNGRGEMTATFRPATAAGFTWGTAVPT